MMQFTIISPPTGLVKGFFGFFEIFFHTIIYKKKNPPKWRIFYDMIVFLIFMVFFSLGQLRKQRSTQNQGGTDGGRRGQGFL